MCVYPSVLLATLCLKFLEINSCHIRRHMATGTTAIFIETKGEYILKMKVCGCRSVINQGYTKWHAYVPWTFPKSGHEDFIGQWKGSKVDKLGNAWKMSFEMKACIRISEAVLKVENVILSIDNGQLLDNSFFLFGKLQIWLPCYTPCYTPCSHSYAKELEEQFEQLLRWSKRASSTKNTTTCNLWCAAWYIGPASNKKEWFSPISALKRSVAVFKST